MNNLSNRFKDLILSVYLFNEWRGYTQLERELIPQLESSIGVDDSFTQAVKKHAADEKKHYNMFKGYFVSNGRMPLAVGRCIGYFDLLARFLLGSTNDISRNERHLAKLCRAIITTERRGIQQLDIILAWPFVKNDEHLRRVFLTIRQDEPSHILPYEMWLKERGYRGPSFFEACIDIIVHYTIAFIFIPIHYCNFRLKRSFRLEFDSQ